MAEIPKRKTAKELGAALTPKQRAWADAWIETGNATEAAATAGYSGTREQLAVVGHGNRRKPNVMAYVDAVVEESIDIAGRGARLRLLTEIAMGRGKADKATPSGQVVKVAPGWGDRLRALDLIEKTQSGGVEVRVERGGGTGSSTGTDGAEEVVVVKFTRGQG